MRRQERCERGDLNPRAPLKMTEEFRSQCVAICQVVSPGPGGGSTLQFLKPTGWRASTSASMRWPGDTVTACRTAAASMVEKHRDPVACCP